LIYADPDGDTQLAVDQPSLLFASYGQGCQWELRSCLRE